MAAIVLLFILFLFSALIGGMAGRMNRSGVGWFFISMIISPLLAFILLMVLPTVETSSDDSTSKTSPSGNSKSTTPNW